MSDRGLPGLANINIELTSRCNKECWICGRRRVEKERPEIARDYGDLPFALLERIAAQLPPRIVVQLHNNGEALLYPRFGEAVDLFPAQFTNIVTNGKLLAAKADEIIGRLDTLAVSVIENDPEADEQLAILRQFLAQKGERKPRVLLRLNGRVDAGKYAGLGLPLATRILHSPYGSRDYREKDPTVPEIGVCLDLLHHLSVNRKGQVSVCVRFDPAGLGVLGDAAEKSLAELWNGEPRQGWVARHLRGERAAVPLCAGCDFWGVPTGWSPRERSAKEGREKA